MVVSGLLALDLFLSHSKKRALHTRVGLALVLDWSSWGTKMLLASVYKIPTLVSLGVVAALLTASAIASLFRPSVVRRSGLDSEQS